MTTIHHYLCMMKRAGISDLSSFSCLPEVGGGVSYLNRLQQLRDTFVCSYSNKFLIVLNHPYLVGCLPLLQNKSLLFSMYMKDKKIAWQNKLLNNGISRLYVHWQSTGTTPLFVWCGEILFMDPGLKWQFTLSDHLWFHSPYLRVLHIAMTVPRTATV